MESSEPMVQQPCVSCGRSTTVGTQLFAGRRVIPPAAEATAAERSYLCEECSEQIHVAAREARLTDEQLREKIASGEIAGFTYKGMGRLTGSGPGGEAGAGGGNGG